MLGRRGGRGAFHLSDTDRPERPRKAWTGTVGKDDAGFSGGVWRPDRASPRFSLRLAAVTAGARKSEMHPGRPPHAASMRPMFRLEAVRLVKFPPGCNDGGEADRSSREPRSCRDRSRFPFSDDHVRLQALPFRRSRDGIPFGCHTETASHTPQGAEVMVKVARIFSGLPGPIPRGEFGGLVRRRRTERASRVPRFKPRVHRLLRSGGRDWDVAGGVRKIVSGQVFGRARR